MHPQYSALRKDPSTSLRSLIRRLPALWVDGIARGSRFEKLCQNSKERVSLKLWIESMRQVSHFISANRKLILCSQMAAFRGTTSMLSIIPGAESVEKSKAS